MQQKSEPLAIRIPFGFDSIQQIQKILNQDIQHLMHQKKNSIPFKLKSLDLKLKRKKITKPLHLVNVKTVKSKRTGEIKQIIDASTVLSNSYDYEDMPDFINFRAKPLNEIKDFFQTRFLELIQNPQKTFQQDITPYIQPQHFLKPYNLGPPACNFFSQKEQKRTQQITAISISFGEPIPQIKNFNKALPSNSNKLLQTLNQYFQKRPCWLRNPLTVQLKNDGLDFTQTQFKNVLKLVAFTFKNGPWKRTYCRLGFDPQATIKTVIFQNVSVKVKNKQAQDYQDYQQNMETYDPTLKIFPQNRYIVSYQFCDIQYTPINSIIDQCLKSAGRECSAQRGWLSPQQNAAIVQLIKDKYCE